MKNLNYQLKQLCKDNRDGSYGTQTARSRILGLIADQLRSLGFRRTNAQSLKPKHILALVHFWKTQGISAATQKNRLSATRWWAKKINKTSVVVKDNSQYGIGRRTYVTAQSKAQMLDLHKLSKVNDERVQLSLKMQAEFGLRREESIKFQPNYAIQNDHIRLKASWCKGGRSRTVPIINDQQRRLLSDVKARAMISAELGHSREAITTVYLGR